MTEDVEYELREARSEIARHHVYTKAMEDLLEEMNSSLGKQDPAATLLDPMYWRFRIREVLNLPGRPDA